MTNKAFLFLAYLGLTLIAYGLWAAIQFQLNWPTGQWALLYGGAGCWLALICHIAIPRRFAKEARLVEAAKVTSISTYSSHSAD